MMKWMDGLAYVLPPLLCAGIIFASFYAGPDVYERIAASPVGFQEMITTLFLVFAIIGSFVLLSRPQVRFDRVLRRWISVYAAGLVYFLGEDINWGQYIFGLQPPDFFLERNKEHEINLHNMSSWFNQKPRLVVEAWVFVAGVLVPLGWSAPRRWTRKFVPDALWPDARSLPLALCSLVLIWPKRVAGFSTEFSWMNIRLSEIQEVFFAYFMLVYLFFLWGRIRAGASNAPA